MIPRAFRYRCPGSTRSQPLIPEGPGNVPPPGQDGFRGKNRSWDVAGSESALCTVLPTIVESQEDKG